MGIVRGGVPTELAIQLRNKYNLQVFVETGTHYGDTALWAAKHFNKVITVEFSQKIYDEVLKRHSQVKNIEFLFGHSKEQIQSIVPKLKEPALFWLDAHWSGNVTYGKGDECPLLEELEIINNSEFDHFIMIDDARLFTSPPPLPHQVDEWPNISEVIKKLNFLGGKSRYTVIVEDVIVSVPEYAKSLIAKYSQDINTKLSQEYSKTRQSPGIIQSSNPQEKDLIEIVNVVNFFETATQYLVDFRLEKPTKRATDTIVRVRGWVVGKKSPVKAIELVNGGQVLDTIPVDWERHDVAQAFPNYLKTGENSGFRKSINSHQLSNNNQFTLQAVLKDETRVPIAEVTFRKRPNKQNAKQNIALFRNSGESHVISRFIKSDDIVFDVGASVGNWTQEVLAHHPNAEIHIFEPRIKAYRNLVKNLSAQIPSGKIIANNFAVAKTEEIKRFYDYESAPELSTFYRRVDVEKRPKFKPPIELPILTTTIDNYCHSLGIKRINFLKIDVEGSELDVLHGCDKLLKQGKIDYIQFEYGGTYIDSKTTLKQVFNYLQSCRYLIFKMLPDRVDYLPQFLPEYENYGYANFLAVNERFNVNILGGKKDQMLDIAALCQEHSINISGVVHIGAHMGQELGEYQRMNVKKVLFIEANPVVSERLQKQVANLHNVQVVNCAITNRNGIVNLHVTSNEQSSSILPLKGHSNIYPNIKETHQVNVPGKTLDTLLQELGNQPEEFNFLNIDIQGAELLALQGATNLLKYVDAINTEINYEELYEGCALIDEIDEFLEQHGFERVATTTPNPTWGDAFYIRKPVVTVSELGFNGRFGNQIFQYGFLKTYALKHNLRAETPNWIGQYLFGHKDPPISRLENLQKVKEIIDGKTGSRSIPDSEQPFKDVDFFGYFQLHFSYYAPYKEYFKSLFQPIGEVKSTVAVAMKKLQERGKTIVGLHLRQGDYKHLMREKRSGITCAYVAPNEWYKDWLAGLWETLEEPVLFIASDEVEEVVSDFADYNPVTVKDLGIELPQTPDYPDFYILSQCDVLAISNSSFSFAASVLNERGKFFFRPHFQAKKLIPYDPWNSEPLLWWKRDDIDMQKLLPEEDLREVVDVVRLAKTPSEHLEGFSLGKPRKGNKTDSSIGIRGWVLGKTSPAKSVELVSDGQVFQTIQVDIQRLDVARAFPSYSKTAENSGFDKYINFSQIPSDEFTLQVVLENQIRLPLLAVKLRKIITQESQPLSHLQQSQQAFKQLQSRLQQIQAKQKN
ncbi:FkbM family methyltransferase [Okeania sp.]|uniref:FkbM family methyltransferase n=1 Tax=Okeania sp. TaxID=3100323 RepID=UPI002B4AB162|nr:FkbM family methyltransferase [Okeania sp.]MEB3343439.1 FkbM family methyltransferase [Okeania sp.]